MTRESARDNAYLRHAVRLAREAEVEGNLPVGAVITLDGQVIAEGRNHVRIPVFRPLRHAEMEALRGVATQHWLRAGQMTCYTTLEPCVMCLGALILHGVGRVVFGARDRLGGALDIVHHLPDFVTAKADAIKWIGPALPEVCDPLSERVVRRLLDDAGAWPHRDRPEVSGVERGAGNGKGEN